jgi:hypothetical protein
VFEEGCFLFYSDSFHIPGVSNTRYQTDGPQTVACSALSGGFCYGLPSTR